VVDSEEHEPEQDPVTENVTVRLPLPSANVPPETFFDNRPACAQSA
jgi:hypothetical protein